MSTQLDFWRMFTYAQVAGLALLETAKEQPWDIEADAADAAWHTLSKAEQDAFYNTDLTEHFLYMEEIRLDRKVRQ